MSETKNKELTDKEKEFCDLYVNGGIDFAGKPSSCYREVFEDGTKLALDSRAQKLMSESHILNYIKELTSGAQYEVETIAVKLQVAETLKAVMEETSKNDYVDRFGIPLSPAPLRAVSVNAAKALMDLYPIKHAQESKLRIEGADGNVIFNVIVPNATEKPPKEEE